MKLFYSIECDVFYKYFFVAPPSPPQNLRIIDVTSKSITLEWETPASNGGSELLGNYFWIKF